MLPLSGAAPPRSSAPSLGVNFGAAPGIRPHALGADGNLDVYAPRPIASSETSLSGMQAAAASDAQERELRRRFPYVDAFARPQDLATLETDQRLWWRERRQLLFAACARRVICEVHMRA